jgi:hypothetical protein
MASNLSSYLVNAAHSAVSGEAIEALENWVQAGKDRRIGWFSVTSDNDNVPVYNMTLFEGLAQFFTGHGHNFSQLVEDAIGSGVKCACPEKHVGEKCEVPNG